MDVSGVSRRMDPEFRGLEATGIFGYFGRPFASLLHDSHRNYCGGNRPLQVVAHPLAGAISEAKYETPVRWLALICLFDHFD